MKKFTALLMVLLIVVLLSASSAHARKINESAWNTLEHIDSGIMKDSKTTSPEGEMMRLRNELIFRLINAKTYEDFRNLEKESRQFKDVHESVLQIWDITYISKAVDINDIDELKKLLLEVWPSGQAYTFIKDKIAQLELDKQGGGIK